MIMNVMEPSVYEPTYISILLILLGLGYLFLIGLAISKYQF